MDNTNRPNESMVIISSSELRRLIEDAVEAGVERALEGVRQSDDETVDHGSAAAFLGCSESTLYKRAMVGAVPRIRVGRENRYRMRDLREYRARATKGAA